MTTARRHEFSPTPSEVLRYFLVWLRGFHRNREKSKAADWAMVVLTLFALVAAVVSAWYLRGQLLETRKATQAALEQVKEARRSTDAALHNFRVDERAWIEIDHIERAKWGRVGNEFRIFVKNTGKTVARDLVIQDLDRETGPGIPIPDADWIRDHMDGPHAPKRRRIARVIAPNQIAPSPAEFMQMAMPSFFSRPEDTHTIVGRLEYVDEFNVSHWNVFCFFANQSTRQVVHCPDGDAEDNNPEDASR